MKKFFKDNLLLILCGFGVLILIIISSIVLKDSVSFKEHICIYDLDENKIVYCSDVDYHFINSNDILIKIDDCKILLSTINKNYLISNNCLVDDDNDFIISFINKEV